MPSELLDTIDLKPLKQKEQIEQVEQVEHAEQIDIQTEKFLDDYVKKFKDSKSIDVTQKGGYDTESLYKEIMDKYIKKDNMRGGGCSIIEESGDKKSYKVGGCGGDDNKYGGYSKVLPINKIRELLIKNNSDAYFSPYTTDHNNFILSSEKQVNSMPSQFGGKNKTRKGKRKLKMNNDESVNRPSELYRLLNRQTDDIRKRILEKIMDIMGIDEETAFCYRAALWRKIKEEHPEMKTSIEKHVKMEKMTTKKELSKISKDKIKEIQEHMKKKKKSTSESSLSEILEEPHIYDVSETSSEFSHHGDEESPDVATSDNSIESLTNLSETSLE